MTTADTLSGSKIVASLWILLKAYASGSNWIQTSVDDGSLGVRVLSHYTLNFVLARDLMKRGRKTSALLPLGGKNAG